MEAVNVDRSGSGLAQVEALAVEDCPEVCQEREVAFWKMIGIAVKKEQILVQLEGPLMECIMNIANS